MDTSPSSLKGDGDAIISSGKGEGMVTSPFYLKESVWPPIQKDGHLTILYKGEWMVIYLKCFFDWLGNRRPSKPAKGLATLEDLDGFEDLSTAVKEECQKMFATVFIEGSGDGIDISRFSLNENGDWMDISPLYL